MEGGGWWVEGGVGDTDRITAHISVLHSKKGANACWWRSSHPEKLCFLRCFYLYSIVFGVVGHIFRYFLDVDVFLFSVLTVPTSRVASRPDLCFMGGFRSSDLAQIQLPPCGGAHKAPWWSKTYQHRPSLFSSDLRPR